MSVTATAQTAAASAQQAARPSVWKHGVAAAVAAALAVTALAAVARSAGVSFAGPDGASSRCSASPSSP